MVRRDCDCPDVRLCQRCYDHALFAARGQAETIGQCWAERVCRGDLRARDAWPTEDAKTLGIAARLVRALTTDPRMVGELAAACSRGAAAWWARRPARYRL